MYFGFNTVNRKKNLSLFCRQKPYLENLIYISQHFLANVSRPKGENLTERNNFIKRNCKYDKKRYISKYFLTSYL